MGSSNSGMEFLRDGVDLQAISGRALAGDAHLFEEATTPAKIRQYLDSTKVCDFPLYYFFI